MELLKMFLSSFKRPAYQSTTGNLIQNCAATAVATPAAAVAAVEAAQFYKQ